jgi:hypothetical protein
MLQTKLSGVMARLAASISRPRLVYASAYRMSNSITYKKVNSTNIRLSFLDLYCPHRIQNSLERRLLHTTAYRLRQDDSDNKNDDGNAPKSAPAAVGVGGVEQPQITTNMSALAPIQIPEYFPKVPLIAVSRNPLFPRFIKMVK